MTRRDKASHMRETQIRYKRREGKQLRENFFLTYQKAQRQSQLGPCHSSNDFNARHGGLSKRKTYSANAFPAVSSMQMMEPNYKTTEWTSKPVLSDERNRLNLSCKVSNDGRLSGNVTTPLCVFERTQFTREVNNTHTAIILLNVKTKSRSCLFDINLSDFYSNPLRTLQTTVCKIYLIHRNGVFREPRQLM